MYVRGNGVYVRGNGVYVRGNRVYVRGCNVMGVTVDHSKNIAIVYFCITMNCLIKTTFVFPKGTVVVTWDYFN